MDKQAVRNRYEDAVNSFIEKIKKDVNVIAVIVQGSLSYDVVWEKSDVDMTVVVRDQNITTKSYCIDEDNIVLNAEIVQRSQFKRHLERQTGGSFGHSYLLKGRILYTTDESLNEYFEEAKQIGTTDMQRSIFYMAGELFGLMNKVQKWLVVKDDVTYARLYALKAAQVIASMEVCRNLTIPTREAVLQATELNPQLMERFYQTPMKGSMTKDELFSLVDDMDRYLESNIDNIMNIALECLGDGEVKTLTQISNYYKVEGHFIVNIFEYLNEKGKIERLSETIRITPKGKMLVEEVAFLYVKD